AADGDIANSLSTDVLQGGKGETFYLRNVSGDGELSAADFAAIIGVGDNTLALSTDNTEDIALNLTELTGQDGSDAPPIKGISAIDLSNVGDNHLTLDASVTTIFDGTLQIFGDSSDSISLEGDGWRSTGDINQNGNYVYTLSDEENAPAIEVAASLTRLVQGENGDTLNVLTAQDVVLASEGDNVVNLVNGLYGSLDGGGGHDVLHISTNINLKGVSTIVNFDVLELEEGVTVELDADAVRTIAGTAKEGLKELAVDALVNEAMTLDNWLALNLSDRDEWNRVGDVQGDVQIGENNSQSITMTHGEGADAVQLMILLHSGT
ncbi:hypothetical protein LJC46_09130, partial [Desulfovibrio sp. OttesenSCG-928-G15]|nr:hypothetical protein [Desulfovibrio sp. OttesenSCG-928-G15]